MLKHIQNVSLIICLFLVVIFFIQAFGDVNRNPGKTSFGKIYFSDSSNGWILGWNSSGSIILRSADSGKTWNKAYSTNLGLNGMAVISNIEGWAVGKDGLVLHTVDGGKTWTKRASGTTETLTAVQTVRANEIWAVGTGGIIVRSIDGGKSWTSSKHVDVALYDVAFLNESTGYIAGFGKILKTDDGGSTWIVLDSPEWKHLGIVVARPSGTWITADTVLLGITQAKTDPLVRILPEQGKITGINFVDDNHGWVVKTRATGGGETDSEGIILISRDGGKSWSKQALFSSNTDDSYLFVSVSFVNRLNGWVLGRNGTLLRTEDGGNTWSESKVLNPLGR